MEETERSYKFYDVPQGKPFEVWLRENTTFEDFFSKAENIGLVHRKTENSRMSEGRAQPLARCQLYVVVHRSSVLEINEKTTFEALDVGKDECVYLFYEKSDENRDEERLRQRSIREAILEGKPQKLARAQMASMKEENYITRAEYYMVPLKKIRAAFGGSVERQ